MQGDAVVDVFGQLVQGYHSGLMHRTVVWFDIAHERGDRSGFAERRSVLAPHAAASYGVCQMAPEPVVGLHKTTWTVSLQFDNVGKKPVSVLMWLEKQY